MTALSALGAWPVGAAAAAVVTPAGVADAAGPQDQPFRWASVSKILTALATWVAIEEGSVCLDQPAGPAGSTLRHLLAHASGLAFEGGAVLARPASRRIYSNHGIELVAEAVAAGAGIPFAAYLQEGVLDPLGMRATRLEGSPAHGVTGPVAELALLGIELLRPTLVSRTTLATATTVAYPELAGVLPGYGRHDPNYWGLGVEVRGRKDPHWTPAAASPRTFGHFGQAGGFLWVDPDAEVGLACLTDRDFGPWTSPLWPELGADVLAATNA